MICEGQVAYTFIYYYTCLHKEGNQYEPYSCITCQVLTHLDETTKYSLTLSTLYYYSNMCTNKTRNNNKRSVIYRLTLYTS